MVKVKQRITVIWLRYQEKNDKGKEGEKERKANF